MFLHQQMTAMTKQEIFDTIVLKLIHKKGFKAMTIRDIAKEVDCDVANIYNYTTSKSALLVKYLFDISHTFHQEADQIIASVMDPLDKLKAIIGLHVRLSHTRPLEVALLANEYRNLPSEQLKRFNSLRRNYEKKIKKLLEEGAACQQFSITDSEITTQAILGSLRWMYNHFNTSQDLNPFDVESQLTDMILTGIRS